MHRASKLQICVLMFLHAFALGAYVVPLPNVLKAYGLEAWTSYPYLISAVAAFISPLIVGSLADRRYAPERLLAVVAIGSAVLLTVVGLTLHWHLGVGAYLAATTCYQFWAAPGFGLLTAIGLMSVDDPQRDFAPLRSFATLGFAVGAAFISFVMHADRSATSMFLGAGFFLVESIFLLKFPAHPPPSSAAPKRLRDYFGWDALQLLRQRDHFMIFTTTALFSMPMAAFYPYIGKHLDSLGEPHPAGILSLAQLAEMIGMFGLAALMTRIRLKWLITAGLIVGLLRYLLFIPNSLPLIMLGVSLHGLIFILFSMTTQIYVEQRVPHTLRNQAQALLTFMTSGIGNLVGYSVGQLWYQTCLQGDHENWPKFWSVLAATILPVILFFIHGYHGKKARPQGKS
jgi:Nucleoside H+ symporter